MQQINIDSPQAIDQFISRFIQLQGRWPAQSPAQRLMELENLANQTFELIGVSSVEKFRSLPLSKETETGAQAEFMSNRWAINVNGALLDKTQLSIKEKIALATYLYHEMRHAQQFFYMAKYLSTQAQPPTGKPLTPQQIQGKTSIPLEVINQAIKAPPLNSQQLEKANQWYQSIYGTGRQYRTDFYAKEFYPTINAYQQAFNDYNQATNQAPKNPDRVTSLKLEKLYQDLIAKYQKFKAADTKYRALPEEKDAYTIGSLLENRYKQKVFGQKSVFDKQIKDHESSVLNLSPPVRRHQRPLETAEIKARAHQLNPHLADLLELTKQLQQSATESESIKIQRPASQNISAQPAHRQRQLER